MRQRKSADMRQALKRHPDSLGEAATHIEVDVVRGGADRLVLTYFVTGDIGNLCLPPATAAARAHALWEHTCFEAFIRAFPSEAYYELNFAPSTRWAAYWLSCYRSGMEAAGEIGDPAIAVQSRPERYTLQASLDVGELSRLPPGGWRLGLSALIEDLSGRKSYWTLAHPPGKPDFHHSDCFALAFP
jgi:hypothetical protein